MDAMSDALKRLALQKPSRAFEKEGGFMNMVMAVYKGRLLL